MHWKDITGSNILEFNMLNENRADLYHGCTLPRAISILKSGYIHPSNYDDHDGISLTRDPNLWFAQGEKGRGNVTFVLDQNKIRQNFKLKPYDWLAHDESDGHDGWSPREESEERIFTDKPLPVNNSYVKEILLPLSMKNISPDNKSPSVDAIAKSVVLFMNEANRLGIPVRYVQKKVI